MRFYKIISLILHPAVVPTIGVLLYFLLIPEVLTRQQELYILALVFVVTYVIPIILLFLLRGFGFIKNLHLRSIKERKIPIIVMIGLFFFLGKTFTINSVTYDLGTLFYASAVGLIVVNVLFFWNIKTSLHLMGMGNTLGFLIVLNYKYGINILPFIMLTILISGLLGSARINLKAHLPKEVYIGFLLGFISQIALFYFL